MAGLQEVQAGQLSDWVYYVCTRLQVCGNSDCGRCLGEVQRLKKGQLAWLGRAGLSWIVLGQASK